MTMMTTDHVRVDADTIPRAAVAVSWRRSVEDVWFYRFTPPTAARRWHSLGTTKPTTGSISRRPGGRTSHRKTVSRGCGCGDSADTPSHG
jgi:hypothetical protein